MVVVVACTFDGMGIRPTLAGAALGAAGPADDGAEAVKKETAGTATEEVMMVELPERVDVTVKVIDVAGWGIVWVMVVPAVEAGG